MAARHDDDDDRLLVRASRVAQDRPVGPGRAWQGATLRKVRASTNGKKCGPTMTTRMFQDVGPPGNFHSFRASGTRE